MKEVYYEPTGMGNNPDETPEDGIQIIDSYGTIHDTSLHWHHALELVLMLSGGVIYTVDGTSHRTNAGELHIINSQHIHQAVNANPSDPITALVIQITDSYLKRIAPGQEQSHFIIERGSDAERSIREDLYVISEAIRKGRQFHHLLVRSRLLHIVYVLLTECRTDSKPPTKESLYSKAAIQYVTSHYMEKVSLDQVAVATGLQKNYFCRCFKKETGITFMQYLNQIRLNVALSLLSEGNIKMIDCALQAGFASEKVMIDWCKKIHQTTPMQYVRTQSLRLNESNP